VAGGTGPMSAPLTVTVALDRANFEVVLGDRSLVEDVRLGALRYLREIVQDFAVERTATLTVGPSGSGRRHGLEVRVARRPCRIPPMLCRGLDATEPRALVRSIAWTLYENRTLLVGGRRAAPGGETATSRVRRHLAVRRAPDGETAKARAPGRQMRAGPPSEDRLSVDLWLSGASNRILDQAASEAPEMPRDDRLFRLQHEIFWELGVIVPTIKVDVRPDLAGNEFRLRLNGIRLPPCPGLEIDERLVDATPGELRLLLGVDCESAVNPANGKSSAIVSLAAAERCREAGLTTWGPVEFVLLGVRGVLRRSADSFVSSAHVRHLLALLGDQDRALVEAVSARLGAETLATLAAVLRELARERVSVRDFRAICEGLLAVSEPASPTPRGQVRVFLEPGGPPSPTLGVFDYAAGIRRSLGRSLAHALGRGNQTLRVFLLSRALEQELRELGERRLSAARHRRLIAAVGAVIRPWDTVLQPPIILSAGDVRRRMRLLIEVEFPWLPVMSVDELPGDKTAQIIGEIPGWDGPGPDAT